MKSFKEWCEQVKSPTPEITMNQSGPTAWKASKEEIVDHWKKLPPGIPMSQMRSVPTNHVGPTYSYDGLRITGSSQWIDYVLARLKDVLNYESAEGGQTRLQVIYKQIVDNKTQQPVPESYVFYLQVKQRENKKKTIKTENPTQLSKPPKIKPSKFIS